MAYQSSLNADQFKPAETIEEAIARIYSTTGGTPQPRGEKRALVALRDSLKLDIDVAKTNAVFGKTIASELGIVWKPEIHTIKNKVTLEGLNVLLQGAQSAFQSGSLERIRTSAPDTLDSNISANFLPAVSKIEAVNRISALTNSGPETLGPGSKEHKSVLINLARHLFTSVDYEHLSKTRLASELARQLGVGWDDRCYSTGETISLRGLNTILAGAEKWLNLLGSTSSDAFTTPEIEANALISAIRHGINERQWEARDCILWMHENEIRGANENEWQGWYFEAKGRELLNMRFTPNSNPPQSRFGNTVFDYRLNRVWDLKSHTAEKFYPLTGRSEKTRPVLILNDVEAIKSCVENQGLGFLVLSGRAEMDEDGSFVEWHREFKRKQGIVSTSSNSGNSRIRKTAFVPISVEAFWVPNTESLNAAIAGGKISIAKQGRQAPKQQGSYGAPRAPKFHMNLPHARSGFRIAESKWS